MDDLEETKSSRHLMRFVDDASQSRQSLFNQHEVCKEVLRKLTEAGFDAVEDPNFPDELLVHFNRLPNRYALDVNTDRAEDVLLHKTLLRLAEIPENRPVFHVRAVHVLPMEADGGESSSRGAILSSDQTNPNGSSGYLNQHLSAYAPAFGPASRLGQLVVDVNNASMADEGKNSDGQLFLNSSRTQRMPIHEVTFSSIDKTKLLSQLSSLLADVGLNIREAHVFSTTDGYSLDVFVVDGWPTEDTEDLEEALKQALSYIEKGAWSRTSPSSSPTEPLRRIKDAPYGFGPRPPELADDWELDGSLLKLSQKVASGSFGDLYRGTYRGQDVAIKVLKHEQLSDELEREFSQEVFIMRKVRHKNVVQFIGACTKAPHLCIVTEFMSGGSLYDYVHKHRGVLNLSMLLRVALDVSKGMDYLHQNNIIHRDLKAANLLMDENDVVKVADFGVARFQAQNGEMTAETGTYRWMAPEVINHWPYGHKADIFSFGIVLWELLTRKLPYESMTPVQAAIGVRQGLRPEIPESTHPKLSALLESCWQAEPSERPDFSEINLILQDILQEVGENDQRKRERR